jgi:hypothetical protein
LQELEEIYIDTSNTLNVAIEGHALLLLTKVNEHCLILLLFFSFLPIFILLYVVFPAKITTQKCQGTLCLEAQLLFSNHRVVG